MPPVSGSLVDRVFRSRALYRSMRLHVYLPPRYGESDLRYPVAYLLHPWGCDETYWTDAINLPTVADRLIDAGALPPFVAVMPQGDKSFFVNAEDPGGDFSPVTRLDPDYFEKALDGFGDYGDYLLEDVIPTVEKKFRIRTDRDSRAIAGISMGGAGAAVLAFTHPEQFCAVGIHSPALFTEERLGPPWIFGLGDPDAFASRDPLHLVGQLDPRDSLRIYVDCGLDDDLAPAVGALHDALTGRGIRHTYVTRPGPHHREYWGANLAEYLGFYAAGW